MQPLFLDFPKGPVWASHYPARSGQGFSGCKGAVLALSPLMDEMHLSRKAMSCFAQRLSQHGWSVLILDPFGTGDSAGDFSQLSWDSWLNDLFAAAKWLSEHNDGSPVTLWAVRQGALIVPDLMQRLSADALFSGRLILWQPVLSGRSWVNQLVRLHQ